MYRYFLSSDDYTFIKYPFPLVDECVLKGYLARNRPGKYDRFNLKCILATYLENKVKEKPKNRITSALSNENLYPNYWIKNFVTRLANSKEKNNITLRGVRGAFLQVRDVDVDVRFFVWRFNISYKPDGRYNVAYLNLDSLNDIKNLRDAFIRLYKEGASIKTNINFKKTLHQNLDLIQENGKLKIRFNIKSDTFTFYRYFSIDDVKQIIEILGDIPEKIGELTSSYDKSQMDFFDSYSELVEFVGKDYDSFINNNKTRLDEEIENEIMLKEKRIKDGIVPLLLSIRKRWYYKYEDVPIYVSRYVDSLLEKLSISHSKIIFWRETIPRYSEETQICVIMTLDGVYRLPKCGEPLFIKWNSHVSIDQLKSFCGVIHHTIDIDTDSIQRFEGLLRNARIEDIKNAIFG